jgi:quercetin dioxygenase-like cupin family protein
MEKPRPINIREALDGLQFLEHRTPTTPPEESERAFARLSDYRDGAIFIGHYAGNSAWERHSGGDEVVFVLEGETTLFLLTGGQASPNRLRAGEFMVVPKSTWHRFETPTGVKIMSITPQPTDHSVEQPTDA